MNPTAPLRTAPEVERLRELAATCYAGLGAECNLPEAWLDALLAASNGEPFSTDGLLPFSAVDGQMGDERAAFDKWFAEWRAMTWKAALTKQEARDNKPIPFHWGDFSADPMWEGWMARAALSAPGAGEKQGEKT